MPRRRPAWPDGVAREAAAAIGGRSFDLTARISRAPGDEGVLYATGTENSGLTVFVQDGRLVVDYNAFDDHAVVASDVPVPAGECIVAARFRRDDHGGGAVELLIDDTPAGTARLPLYMRMISSSGASVGRDHGSAVSARYEAPFPFTGTLHEVEIQLVGRPATDAATSEARAEMFRQ